MKISEIRGRESRGGFLPRIARIDTKKQFVQISEIRGREGHGDRSNKEARFLQGTGLLSFKNDFGP
ncbi:MAG: hypothetical protein WA089_16530 [Anaerolineae bacterium]